MNKIVSILLIAFNVLILSSCTARKQYRAPDPQLITINIVDRNGVTETISNPERLVNYQNVDFLKNQPYQRVLRVYSRDVNGDVYAYLTSYHENGQPRQYLEIVNNRALGSYREWHLNGALAVEACIIGGIADLSTGAEKSWLFDGLCSAWDEDGNLEAQIHYAKGVLEGPSLYYHKNGSLWKTMEYVKGAMEGVSEIYKDDGELLQTATYEKGNKHGESIRYWAGARVAALETYDKGRLLQGKFYGNDGELVAQITDGKGTRAVFGKETVCELHQYIDGYQQGSIELFSPDGKILCRYKTKDGLKHGEEVFYYEPTKFVKELRPKLSINWYKGIIQGVMKTWYPEGQQESQREMTSNCKNGMLTAWYKDGSLMLIEEYDKDVLVKGEYYKSGTKLPISEVSNGEGLVTLYDPEGNFVRKINYRNGKPFEI